MFGGSEISVLLIMSILQVGMSELSNIEVHDAESRIFCCRHYEKCTDQSKNKTRENAGCRVLHTVVMINASG